MRQVFSSYEFPILEDEYIYIFSDVLMAYEEHNIADLTRQMIAFVSEKKRLHSMEISNYLPIYSPIYH